MISAPPRPKRHLQSLEPQLRRYCTKAWDTHGRAKRSKGADPNAPREPIPQGATRNHYSREVRVAARIVDVWLGANPSVLDSVFEESDHELSDRLRILVDGYPSVSRLLDKGIEAVYLGAGLTRGEANCVRMQHEGISHSGIADITGRQTGTVQALLARAHYKLRLLIAPLEEVA